MPFCAFEHCLGRGGGVFFQNIFFERTAVYAYANGNVKIACLAGNLFYSVLTADISGVYADFVNAVFHTFKRELVVEMNVRNERNVYFLLDFRDCLCAFKVGNCNTDNVTAGIFKTQNLLNTFAVIFCFNVCHRLHGDFFSAAYCNVSDLYFFHFLTSVKFYLYFHYVF